MGTASAVTTKSRMPYRVSANESEKRSAEPRHRRRVGSIRASLTPTFGGLSSCGARGLNVLAGTARELRLTDRCRILDWDTAFFGHRIARLDGDTLKTADVPAILRWVSDNEVACLYFLARPDDDETVHAAELLGCHLIDLRVTLDAKCGDVKEPSLSVRSGRRSDIAALAPIAEASYTDSRFFTDQRFPRDRCRELYRIWLERSFDDYADEVRVAVDGDRPVGFVTCRLATPETGEIGLVGVDPDSRGRGIGGLVTHDSVRWFAEQGVKTVSVPTQGRNIGAQRLYQACGFRTTSIELWFHRWFV